MLDLLLSVFEYIFLDISYSAYAYAIFNILFVYFCVMILIRCLQVLTDG